VTISSLRTAAFRNLADADVFTQAKNVFLVGENGQGKTNFLEALYFCAYASSFRGNGDREIACNGKKDFSAAVTVTESVRAVSESATPAGINGEVLVKFENGKKTVTVDGKRAGDRKELLSVAPCVVFCHEDMEFVAGSPERRRWFFDQVLSLYDPVYLDDLRRYRHALKSRNSVLRDNCLRRLNGDPDSLLDALDPQCVLYGTRLMEKRETGARLFAEVLSPLYGEVSGIDGVSVRYVPSWKETGEAAALALLRQRRAADTAAGISLSGPHRDRYEFTREGAEFTGKASTGQRRLLALLLRAAQARRFSETTGRKPVLLLDDVLLEMDGGKRRRFLSALPGYDQAFFTFLPEEPFHLYRDSDTLVYYVKNGCIQAEEK
jgi:DNA replication and repair protein RecF